MTETEKKLLRQQAEAYAFISDLRQIALMNGDTRYIKLTQGVETKIAKRKKEYPNLFQRYMNEAFKRAKAARLKLVENKDTLNGKREEVPRRKEAPPEEKPPRSSKKSKRKPTRRKLE